MITYGLEEEDVDDSGWVSASRAKARQSKPMRGASPGFEVVDLVEGLPPRHKKAEGSRAEDLSAEGSPPLGAQEPWRDEDDMALQDIGRARWGREVGAGGKSRTSGRSGRETSTSKGPRRSAADDEDEGASSNVYDLSAPSPDNGPSLSPHKSRRRAASRGISGSRSRAGGDSTVLVSIDDDDDIVMIPSSSSSSSGGKGGSAAAAAAAFSSSSSSSGRKSRAGLSGFHTGRLNSNQSSRIVVDIADSPDASASGGAHSSSSSSSSSTGKRRRHVESQPGDCVVVMESEQEKDRGVGNRSGAGNEAKAAGAGGGDNEIEERAKRARMQVASTVSSKRGFTCPVCMEDEWEKGTQVTGKKLIAILFVFPPLSHSTHFSSRMWHMGTELQLRCEPPTLPRCWRTRSLPPASSGTYGGSGNSTLDCKHGQMP